MLTSLELGNFKSVRSATLPLGDLTLLIGANASGKSNVLEAIQILAWIADNGRLETIDAAMKDRRLRVRGPAARLAGGWDKDATFWIGCKLTADADAITFQCALAHTARKGMHVVTEQLWSHNASAALYDVKSPAPEQTNQMTVSYNNFKRGGNKPTILCSDQQAVFNQLLSPARFGETHEESQSVIPNACILLQSALASILFLDPNPSAMRGYSYVTDARMQGDGANLSAVLYALCTEGQKKGDVLDFVRSLPEQDIKDIRFAETARGEVLLGLVETFGGEEREWDAGMLSDGTLRVLAIAAALLSVDQGSLVVIEEIDNGVHPSRAHMLLERVLEVAESRRLRVLVTTHNPALVDALPTKAIGDVVACFRGADGSTQLRRLLDLENYPALVAQGPLGELMTSKVIDRFVKEPKVSVDERKAKIEAWLGSVGGAGAGR